MIGYLFAPVTGLLINMLGIRAKDSIGLTICLLFLLPRYNIWPHVFRLLYEIIFSYQIDIMLYLLYWCNFCFLTFTYIANSTIYFITKLKIWICKIWSLSNFISYLLPIGDYIIGYYHQELNFVVIIQLRWGDFSSGYIKELGVFISSSWLHPSFFN